MAPVVTGPVGIRAAGNPQAAWNQTWITVNTDSGIIVNGTTSHQTPLGAWFPHLYMDLCKLAPIT